MINTIVTACLSYLLVGSLSWSLLYVCGVHEEWERLRANRGQTTSARLQVKVAMQTILCWPSLWCAVAIGFWGRA